MIMNNDTGNTSVGATIDQLIDLSRDVTRLAKMVNAVTNDMHTMLKMFDERIFSLEEELRGEALKRRLAMEEEHDKSN
jgi:hypothetical protein